MRRSLLKQSSSHGKVFQTMNNENQEVVFDLADVSELSDDELEDVVGGIQIQMPMAISAS
jgi:hypothetical protein